MTAIIMVEIARCRAVLYNAGTWQAGTAHLHPGTQVGALSHPRRVHQLAGTWDVMAGGDPKLPAPPAVPSAPPMPLAPIPFPDGGVWVLTGDDSLGADNIGACVTDENATAARCEGCHWHSGRVEPIAAQCCDGETCHRYVGSNDNDGCISGTYVVPPGSPQSFVGILPRPMTYVQAVRACELLGLNLCNQSCRSKGCGYDSIKVWTSLPCKPPPPPRPAPPLRPPPPPLRQPPPPPSPDTDRPPSGPPPSAPEASAGGLAPVALVVACTALAGGLLVGLSFCCRRLSRRRRVAGVPGPATEYSLKRLIGRSSIYFSEASMSLMSGDSVSASVRRLLPAVGTHSVGSSARSSPTAPVIPAGDITLLRKVGRGGHAAVFAGEWLGTTVAIKVVNPRRRTADATRGVRIEAEMLSKLRHPCICSVFGVCDIDDDWNGARIGGVAMVMELLDISLYDFLHRRPPGTAGVHPRLCVRIAHETAMGIAYLHRNHCMHRDIKTANVMLDQMQHARVCDFGLAALKSKGAALDDDDGVLGNPLTTPCEAPSNGSTWHTAGIGTPRFMAPEMMPLIAGSDGAADGTAQTRSQYDERCDVYSFALLLWEAMHQRVPFAEHTGMQVALLLAPSRQRPPLHLPAGFEEVGTLISSCWHHDPAQRPPMSACVEALAASAGSFATASSAQHADDESSSSCTPNAAAGAASEMTAKLGQDVAYIPSVYS